MRRLPGFYSAARLDLRQEVELEVAAAPAIALNFMRLMRISNRRERGRDGISLFVNNFEGVYFGSVTGHLIPVFICLVCALS